MTALLKTPFIESATHEAGAWAFDNHHDPKSISDAHYSLVVPERPVSNLDDLTHAEEVAFWELSFCVAMRAFQVSAPLAIMVGVNDGLYAGQSIPHVHSHIIGVEPRLETDEHFKVACRNMARTCDDLSRTFRPAARLQLERSQVFCNFSDMNFFTTLLRHTRKRMKERTDADSFRIYTGSSIQPDVIGLCMVVDACSANAPQFSFSSAWRALHGKIPYPELAGGRGRGPFTHFQKAAPTPEFYSA